MTEAEMKAYVLISSTLWTHVDFNHPIQIKDAEFLSKLLINTLNVNGLEIKEQSTKNEGEK